MKAFKKIAVTAALTGAALAISASSVGAVTTATWNLYAVKSGYANYSNTWVSNSGANEVVIVGYQDGGSPTYPAYYDYAVVKDEFFGDGDYYVHAKISGNYPKAGTWFSHTFKGIPNGIDVQIRVESLKGYSTNCGGNAYQS